MKKEKYLIVKASDVNKQLYECERIAYCNDFDNIYHRVDKVNLNNVFEENKVPNKFRMIFIKVDSKLFTRNIAEEFTSSFPFEFTTEQKDGQKYFYMHNLPFLYNGSVFDDKFTFNTEENYISFNNIMYILEKMNNEGCLENYLLSIRKFFNNSLDLNLMFEAWKETKNKKRAIRLYNCKISTKSIY